MTVFAKSGVRSRLQPSSDLFKRTSKNFSESPYLQNAFYNFVFSANEEDGDRLTLTLLANITIPFPPPEGVRMVQHANGTTSFTWLASSLVSPWAKLVFFYTFKNTGRGK